MKNPSDNLALRALEARTHTVWVTRALGILFLIIGAQPSYAAGCHVQDRPVLQISLSWENLQEIDPLAPSRILAPPILTHVPCGGETPFAPGSLAHPVVAILIDNSPLPLQSRSGLPFEHTRVHHAQPPSLRLDRPPRLLERRCLLDGDSIGAEVIHSCRRCRASRCYVTRRSSHSWG
jgi:hypothetical protein